MICFISGSLGLFFLIILASAGRSFQRSNAKDLLIASNEVLPCPKGTSYVCAHANVIVLASRRIHPDLGGRVHSLEHGPSEPSESQLK